jgi:hypothetical protein
LLAVQIAICAVLVTSSLVALRGLVHAMHSNFGFEPHNSMLVGADLSMAGYSSDRMPAMQKRMMDAIAAIPGVQSVGITDALLLNAQNGSNVFSDRTTDLRPANAAADVYMYHISPEYLHAEGTTLLSGRAFTWHDDKDSPRVAVVNQEFARKIFGSVENAIGSYFKMPDGARVQVVGVAQNGKYGKLTEEPKPAMSKYLPYGDCSKEKSADQAQQQSESINACVRVHWCTHGKIPKWLPLAQPVQKPHAGPQSDGASDERRRHDHRESGCANMHN